MEIIKCNYLFFSKDGFIKNIGSYIILFILLTNIILLIVLNSKENIILIRILKK